MEGSSARPEAAAIERAFRSLEQSWSSDDAHRRFLALCAHAGALDQGARLYREVRDGDPARRAEASQRLSSILMTALQQLSPSRSKHARRSRRLMWLMVGACGFVVAQALLALLRR